jgi:hypothetical protein
VLLKFESRQIQAIWIDLWYRNHSKCIKFLDQENQYVTVAKQLATQFGVAIDMPAGPSDY